MGVVGENIGVGVAGACDKANGETSPGKAGLAEAGDTIGVPEGV
jgi:hypothetical protein